MRLAFVAVSMLAVFGCSKPGQPPSPHRQSARELALAAAHASFQLPGGDDSQILLELVGDESAAIARDRRVGICSVLYVAADGTWREHTKLKGAPSQDQLAAPLQSAGTAQEIATRNDLRTLCERMCQ